MKVSCVTAFILVIAAGCHIALADEFNNFKVCGKTSTGGKLQRIVGGENANQGELPWQIGVSNDGQVFCGATLISKKWAISAAHCEIKPGNELILGASDLNSQKEVFKKRTVLRAFPHENYDSDTMENDIVLLELNREVTFNDLIAPACIVDKSKHLVQGTTAVVSGWGTLESGGDQPEILQKAEVNIVSRDTCNSKYSSGITKVMLCAAAPGKDSCQGDSGGPLVVDLRDKCGNDQYFLAGVVSFGSGCAHPDYPGVYADVAALRDWIDDKLASKGNVKPSTAEHTCGGPTPTDKPSPPPTDKPSPPPVGAADYFNDKGVCGTNGDTHFMENIQRIVGGVPSKRGELPWQLGLRYGDGQKPYCGATLISKQWLITAAHCKVKAGSQVILGAYDFGNGGNENERHRVKRTVAKVINHENYDDGTYNNDIALVKLNAKIKYTKYIRPACIVEDGEKLADDAEVVISGWGTTKSGGSQPKVLQEAEVKIVNHGKCDNLYGRYKITDKMFCAAYPGKDSCQGDSGGPLVIDKKNNGRDQFYLAGVVSWGLGCANENYPGVYADVANLRNWIQGKLESENGT
ncbi:transmembrane protease serine 9-like [Clytia hemisphaerica]